MKKSVLHFLFLHQFFSLPYLLYLTLRVILPKAMRAAYLRGGTAQIIRCLFSPFAFYLCLSAKNAQIILVFFCGCFSSVSYASPPPANNVHICEVLDYEAMRARDSLYAATKQALNLNVGEPRTVRMIYFLPNDRPFQQEVVDSMKVTIRQIQTFFADHMEAHGHGRKTFRFETDAQGDPVVHRVDGGHPNSYYVQKGGGGFWDDIPRKFDFSANNVYLTVWDNGTTILRPGVGGSGGGGRDRGFATVPARFHWTTVAHELGHAFELGHDWRDGNYIMSYGAGGSGRHSLSACAAEFLSVHPYFDPDIPDEGTPPPTIELISPNEYPTGSTSVSIQLKVSDPDGLHQVILFAEGGLKACRKLNGETNTVVQFDYDGVIPASNDPQGTGTSLSNPLVHNIGVEAVDTGGNVASTSFGLVNDSTQRNVIATLEGDKRVNFLAFSPDGKTLATGGEVWDIATRTETTTSYGSDEIVAFSPDGKTLAEVSFRDGKGYVELWDIATRRNIATFEGHTRFITSVAFSSDGTTLASGGGEGDGTVKLWDVATRRHIATFEHLYSVTSVAFSPDGAILASGSRDNTVKLWDIARKYNVATLEHIWEVRSVAFSPDGTILASIQKKWERNGDGNDVAILLWDMAKLTQPQPHTLVKVSGDKQEGVPSAELANPLVVEVKDQNGNVLEGVVVTFSVTEGDGTLSVKTAMTDSSGRAQTLLTLGNSLEATIVAVTVAGIEQPSTFVIEAVATPDFDGDGTVGFSDFLQFVEQFGFSQEDEGYQVRFDLDGDGVIGFGDFLIFANNFGKKVS